MKTYYEILGVSATATQDEIKKAYKIMIRKWHPDMNPGNDSIKMTQLINEAYSILSDASKRRQYDSKLASTRRQNSSKQKSNSKSYNSYNETTRSANNTKKSTNSTRKLADDIIDELMEARNELFGLYVGIKIEERISSLRKIEIINKVLKASDKVFRNSLAKIGLSVEKVLKCDFSGCKVDLDDLNKVLNAYSECLILKKSLISLKKHYSAKSKKIWSLDDLDTFEENNKFEKEIRENNNINIEKKIIKNKFY